MVNPNQSKFTKDRLAGEAGERRVAKILQRFYGADSITQISNGKEYDFKLHWGDREELFECKVDFASARTGNVCLEFTCGGKLSGLLATKSHKWAIFLPHLSSIVIFAPTEMWDYLETSKHRQVSAGDGKRVQAYLVSIEALTALPFTTSISSLDYENKSSQ